jgi:hypothetical protein
MLNRRISRGESVIKSPPSRRDLRMRLPTGGETGDRRGEK